MQLKFRRGEQVSSIFEILSTCSLFRSLAGKDYVSVPQGALPSIAYCLDSREFKNWTMSTFENAHDAPPSANSLRAALNALKAKAQFGGIGEAPVGHRVITGQNSIVLDLANPESSCVEISRQGWEPQDGFTFHFERGHNTGELPTPTQPAAGTLDRLRVLLNIRTGASWTRILTWITAALRPTGPYPILVLRGASGAGKSTTARMLRALLDPARTPLETLPTTPHRMEQASAHQRILAIDDLDRLPRAVLSALAKAADETNPVILVLSSNFTRELPDTIARRALIVDLEQPQELRTLFAVRQAFEALLPQVLGALCNAASQALANFEKFAQNTYIRLPDAVAWTIAAAPSLYLTESEIQAAIIETKVAHTLLSSTSALL